MKRSIRKIAITCLVALTTLLFPNLAKPQNWLQGQWQGMGDQVDGQRWFVDLDATDLKSIQIDYPGLNCGGRWELRNASENGTIGMEILEYGLDYCNQNVEIVIEPLPNDRIKVVYYLKSYSQYPTATAVLSRAPGS